MSDNGRCIDCDRLDGWKNPPHDGDGEGCECPECCARCWGGPQCMSGAVDWRSRALKAEAALETLARCRAGSHQPFVREEYVCGEGYRMFRMRCPACGGLGRGCGFVDYDEARRYYAERESRDAAGCGEDGP